MKAVVLLLVAVVAAASYLPLIRREAWWIRVFDFPRLQILALGLVALAALVCFRDLRAGSGALALAVLLPALLIQVHRIYPYTPVAPKEVIAARDFRPEETLALFVANVLMGNRESGRLLDLVSAHRPDVVLLLEPDAWWEERMRALEASYPYAVKDPRDNRYGMLLYSRLPLVDPEIRFLVREGVPSMHMRIRLRSGAAAWLYCIHPEPPSPTEAETSAPRDAELLIVGREVKDRDAPTIVTGDLNDVAWSYTTTLFQKTSGLLDPRKGRGMFNTFHARIPLMRWPLDHVFHSNHFLVAELRRLPAFGSDHFPFFVRLAFRPDVATVQEEPSAGAEDREEADRKIRAGREAERSGPPPAGD